MTKRRAFAALVVLAAVATAWLLLGREDSARGDRARRPAAAREPGLPASAAPAESGAMKDAKPEGDPAPPAPAAATASLRVRVVGGDGAAAAGATVEAWAVPADAFPRSPPDAATTTARDGTATLAVAPGRFYEVRASRGEASNLPAMLSPGAAEATLVLESSRGLRGLVLLPEGGPARGYWVEMTLHHAGHAARFTGSTDDRGQFELAPLPEAWLDRLEVEVKEPGQMRSDPGKLPGSPFDWEFEFGREQLLTGAITLQLTAVRLHARVVDEAGTPVARATVHWAPPRAPDPLSFRFVAATDEDGRFDATVQRLAGEAFVIRAPGYAPLVWRGEASEVDRKLHVPEIVLRRGVPLSGRVTDPSGEGVLCAWVRLESPRLAGRIVDQRGTELGGRFAFDAVADEEYVLYVFREVLPDLCLPQLRVTGVRGGPDEVRVTLPAPIHGTVRFVARGTGAPLAVGHLTLIVKDARGAEVCKRTWDPHQPHVQVRFEVWEDGTYDLEVYSARFEPARVDGVEAVGGRGPEVAVPLVPRR